MDDQGVLLEVVALVEVCKHEDCGNEMQLVVTFSHVLFSVRRYGWHVGEEEDEVAEEGRSGTCFEQFVGMMQWELFVERVEMV